MVLLHISTIYNIHSTSSHPAKKKMAANVSISTFTQHQFTVTRTYSADILVHIIIEYNTVSLIQNISSCSGLYFKLIMKI